MQNGLPWEALSVLVAAITSVGLPLIGFAFLMNRKLAEIASALRNNRQAHRRLRRGLRSHGRTIDRQGEILEDHERRIGTLEEPGP